MTALKAPCNATICLFTRVFVAISIIIATPNTITVVPTLRRSLA